MDKPLRISRLIERDFMCIRALDIQPGRKSLVLLKGPNEQGKTSAIRALVSALGGKRFDPDEPIRKGEESAVVDVTLADAVADRLRLTVSWTPKGRYLTVRQLDDGSNMKLPGGQSIIDSLVGALAYDPLEFMRAKPEAQLALLMEAIGKANAYATLQKCRKEHYDQRTIVNRQVREKAAAMVVTPDPSPDEVLQPQNLDAIQHELDSQKIKQQELHEYDLKISAFATETATLTAQRETMWEEIVALKARLEDLKKARSDAHVVIQERIYKHEAAQKKYTALQAATPTSDAIAGRFAAIQEHNSRVTAQKATRALAADHQKLCRDSEQLAEHMATIDAEVRSLLATSNIGQRIPNLAVNADGLITHNNVCISQASGMRQLELSCLIGMVRNPQLRIMAIDEGDKLDEDSLKRLKQIATERDYQIWMTAIYAGNDDDLEHVVNLENGSQRGAAPPGPPSKTNGNQNPVAADDNVAAMYGTASKTTASVVSLDDLEL